MSFDLRQIIVVLAVAVLFSFFSYASFDAFYPQLEYNDFCEQKPYFEINNSAQCEASGGKWTTYQNEGIRPVKIGGDLTGWCDVDHYCREEYEDENSKRDYYSFIVLSIIGVLGILIGLYLPLANPINEWIGTGFMLGGLFDIFFGTARYYQDIGRFVKPIILFLELALVIFLTYKKLGVSALQKKKK
ncbi:hypothetical protein GOV05_00740 [Candidatus Woesearchaeota archaeon]|nr:hypothetical protein [Candidatus Woesearchaeota archaeon]